MKTRYTPLVRIKKNELQARERVFQEASQRVENAKRALREALEELHKIPSLESGVISDFLANRTLLQRQRAIIDHNRSWVEYALKELEMSQIELKEAMITFEKFKYLELQEVEKIQKAKKVAEAKALDEIALMTFNKKESKRRAS
jgi:flagellar biosynthesis chaperone FliJ